MKSRKDDARVSVIVPAHNAAGTISETLETLLAQTFHSWEAVIVDDGSSDETAAVVSEFAKRDQRIRYARQEQGGVSAARNTGVGLARFDWLLFLDADDWLTPTHLERMVEVIEAGIGVDAVLCDAARVLPDGQRFDENLSYVEPDQLFSLFARYCTFPIHACVVRKSAVEAAGMLDHSLRTCEDWDLWQRIARAGALFGVVREVLALYRLRPTSASMNALQILQDGFRVISQGHSADPRVSNPDPEYKDGFPRTDLVGARLTYVCWCAGLVLGRDEDARYLLDQLGDQDREPLLDPYVVAWGIFKAALCSACLAPARWAELQARTGDKIDEFLLALENQAQAPGLAHRTRIALQELSGGALRAAANPPAERTARTVGIDVTEPIPDVFATAERLQCLIKAEGKYLGRLELPICDEFVPAYVIADATAAQFAWEILGLFFERTIYGSLTVNSEENGLSLWRENLRLTEALPVDEKSLREQAHDHVGWTIFLQEVWGRPYWPQSHFYDGQAIHEPAPRQSANHGWVTVEVSDEIPDLEVSGEDLQTILTAGGVAVGRAPIPTKSTSAHELRVALTLASGLELCRTAVREALLGKPFAEPLSLRERLASVRKARLAKSGSGNGAIKDISLAPGSVPAFDPAGFTSEPLLVLGRRSDEAIGTSASRRAMLPAAAFEDLLDSARVGRDPTIENYGRDERPGRVVYAPEVIPNSSQERRPPVREGMPEQERTATLYGRSRFETLFAAHVDPWRYTNPYEQKKYEQTLSLIPNEEIGRAIELACAEGHFTAQLSPRVRNLIASDISQIALDRAARRLANLENVSFLRLDFMKEPLPGRFDLIVCSEVLYYMDEREALQTVARKLADALEPGGYLITSHAYQVTDEPEKPGLDFGHPFGAKVIGDTLSATRGLRLIKEIRTPLYLIQLFRRDDSRLFGFLRKKPEIVEAEHHSPLPPEIADYLRSDGACSIASSVAQQVVTTQLPILMYHSVSTNGSPSLARYRVTPEAFEEQLRYLRDAGFRSVTLEEWRLAIEAKQPLPGRAVNITFDDGYRDFLIEAWPLLAEYGFSATVFLVADRVGQTSEWDRYHGQELPLLGWEEIHELQQSGIEFGSHSTSHRPLIELSVEEVVREAARSKTILEEGLGTHVRAFAYPYGASDDPVHHLIGACGYTFGLTCRPGPSQFHNSHLALPRIEVTGHDGLQEFVTKIGPVG